MELFECIEKRRSVRRFTDEPVDKLSMKKAFEAAILAPNSSNMQTWDFFWVRSDEKKKKLVEYCLSQSAARTAQELVVISADPALWRRSNPEVIKYVHEVDAPKPVKLYYEKIIPMSYRWGLFNIFYPFKWLLQFFVGLARPITRKPLSKRDLQEVAIKSAALAAENFVLALQAEGYSTCMMEGLDEWRVKKLLGLNCSSRIVMAIGIGKEGEKSLWGPRFRIGYEKVVHEV